jgi:hypothetical protein
MGEGQHIHKLKIYIFNFTSCGNLVYIGLRYWLLTVVNPTTIECSIELKGVILQQQATLFEN